MHILILASYYPTTENPIVGTFIEKQALALHRAGHRVGVIVLPRFSATREHLRRAGIASLRPVTHETYFAYADDIPVYRMHWGWFFRPLPPIASALARSAGMGAYRDYVKAHGVPDALYAHDIFYGGVLAAALTRRYGVRSALLEHSTAYQEGRAIFPGQPAIIRLTLRSIDAPLVVGKALGEALHQIAPDVQTQVLGNVVDIETFTRAVIHPPKPFHFTLIASLKERRKRFDLVIAALAILVRAGIDARLTISGDGSLRTEIEAQIAQAGMSERVRMAGRLTPTEVRNLIHASHAVVCASDVETFNVGIAEAMACGVPVLSTRCGGPEDYITPETGILVPPGDADALADGMRRMMAEYDRFDRDAARQIIVERFSERAIVGTLERALTEVIPRKTGTP